VRIEKLRPSASSSSRRSAWLSLDQGAITHNDRKGNTKFPGGPRWRLLTGREERLMNDRFDHIVLIVRLPEATLSSCECVLGFEREIRPAPASLKFGRQKINVHESDRTFEPKAARPTPGAADFCLITHRPMDEIIAHLNDCGPTPVLGPVARVGAEGPITSVYLRDPDANLVEIGRYDD
jgi:catechol 2,3-dioxygenase-like lactoylglutathione lyase family enzyme